MLLEGDISLLVINESDLFVIDDHVPAVPDVSPLSCSRCSGSDVFVATWMILTVSAPA